MKRNFATKVNIYRPFQVSTSIYYQQKCVLLITIFSIYLTKSLKRRLQSICAAPQFILL